MQRNCRLMPASMGPEWTFCFSCAPDATYPLGPYFTLVNSSACSAIPCLSNQGVSPQGTTPPRVKGAGGIRPMMTVWEGRQLAVPNPIWPGNFRFHQLEQWRIPAGFPQEDALEYRNRRAARGVVPYSPPFFMFDPRVDPWPQPEPPPVGSPAPSPSPQPRPQPEPQPIEVPTPTGPIILPGPRPLPDPVPGAPPYIVPGLSQDVTPRPGVSTVAPPAPRPGHSLTRPPRRTKEAKLKHSGAVKLLQGLVNLVTESSDFVDALFRAISYRDRQEGDAVGFMSPLDKASFVYSNFHRINWREFLKNYYKNQAEDWAYGQIGKGSAWMQRQGGISQGFKDAALTGGSSAGTSRGGEELPGLDKINELIDALIGSDPDFNKPYRAASTKPVVKNWRRINKWTKRKRG